MSTPTLPAYHFACCIRSLAHHATHGRGTRSSSMLAAEICRALDVEVFGCADGVPDAAASALLFDLQRMNANAYAERYQSRAPRVKPPDLEHAQLLSPAALLKALRCVRYNCDNGAAVGEGLRESLATLDRVLAALTAFIIDQLPEYDAAEWFLDSALVS